MTATRRPARSLLRFTRLAACFGLAAGLLPVQAVAEDVDSELLLLVDVSNQGVKKGDFDAIMEGYASSMTNAEVLDSIQSGAIGKIAVSMVFFGSQSQTVGIPWMTIGSVAEAELFASRVRTLAEPQNGNYSYLEALDFGVMSFGTETGGTDNGFTSAVQLIEVTGATQPKGGLTTVSDATQDALESGVDLIGATTFGKKADQLESYYEAAVIGSELEGVDASVSNSSDGELASIFTDQISGTLFISSTTTVPEPSVFLFLGGSMALMLCVRRRH